MLSRPRNCRLRGLERKVHKVESGLHFQFISAIREANPDWPIFTNTNKVVVVEDVICPYQKCTVVKPWFNHG